jgi:hypothetical protein
VEEESAVPFAGGDCEIRIKGRLSDSLLAAFEGLMTTVQPVATVLHGPVPDQAALYRLLDRIQSLGCMLDRFQPLRPLIPHGELAAELRLLGRDERTCLPG